MLYGASGTLDISLPKVDPTALTFAINNGTATVGSTQIACFRAGTRILTDKGEISVERFRPGMNVISILNQRVLPVRWIGCTAIDCSQLPYRTEPWPVCVRAGSIGAGVPHRNLWLSPDHSVFVDGWLIPVRYLINGASIIPVACRAVEYFHVELETHGVLLAEGLLTESYLETGNRAAFEKRVGCGRLPPDSVHSVAPAQ